MFKAKFKVKDITNNKTWDKWIAFENNWRFDKYRGTIIIEVRKGVFQGFYSKNDFGKVVPKFEINHNVKKVFSFNK